MEFQPLTKEQYQKAINQGFTHEKIVKFELQRKQDYEKSAKPPGFLQSIAQGIVSPFAKTASTIASAGKGVGLLAKAGGQSILGDKSGAMKSVLEAGQPVDLNLGYFGKAKPISSTKEAVGTGLELGSYLIPGGGKVGMEGVKTAGEAFLRGAVKTGTTGAISGGLMGAGTALQKNESTLDTLKETGVGVLSGGLIGGVMGGLFARKQFLAPKKAQELRNKAIEQYKIGLQATKEKFKDKTDKIIPTLLKEKQYGTFNQLKKKAEQGIELSMEDYKKIGTLKGFIDTADIEGLIEKEMNKLKTPSGTVISVGQSRYKALVGLSNDIKALKFGSTGQAVQSFKSNLSAQLQKVAPETVKKINSLDISTKNVDEATEMVKKSLTSNELSNPAIKNAIDNWQKTSNMILSEAGNLTRQQQLRELAGQYGDLLYESRKAQKTIKDNATLSQVKKVDSAIRSLLNTTNPDYGAVNKIYNFNTELYDILQETAKRKGGQRWFDLTKQIMTSGGLGIGGTIGALSGGATGAVGGAVIGGSALVGLATLLNSTWWNTLRAVQKTKLADKLLKMSTKELPKYLNILSSGGTKAVLDFIEQ